MLNFIWNFKYYFLVIILAVFSYSLFLISSPVIFFETERILKYADDIEIELSQSFDDKNLFLLGVEYEDGINYNEFILLDSIYRNIKEDSIIKSEKSILFDDLYKEFLKLQITRFYGAKSNTHYLYKEFLKQKKP